MGGEYRLRAALSDREVNRRSGIALTKRHKLGGVSTNGHSGPLKKNEHLAYRLTFLYWVRHRLALPFTFINYISHESQTTRNVYWSRASVCLSVCVSVRRRIPTLLHGPGCNLNIGEMGMVGGCPLVVHYWADLQSVYRFRCYDNTAQTRNVSECLYLLYACSYY